MKREVESKMADNLPDYSSNVLPFVAPRTTKIVGSSKSGGGDGMEPRIAKLESDVGHIRAGVDELSRSFKESVSKQTEQRVEFLQKFSDLKTEIVIINEKMSHFATKTYSIATAFGIVAALSALILFAERLKNLLGI